LNSKLTDKDKKDWKNFTSSRDKVPNKDFKINKKNIKENTERIIDLHGFSLENANKIVEGFINNSYQEGIKKVIVVTGKGTRSKTANNPYLSRDLSILKHSVPEFIKSNSSLMNKIKQISEANIEDGGSGAFYIYFKN
jgi:DNA-nicking Smr family endonuclease